METGDDRRQLVECGAGVSDDGNRGVLERVERADVDADELHVRIGKRGLRHGVKSASRVPMAMTRSASRAAWFAARLPVTPIAPSASGWFQGMALWPACVSATPMPVTPAKPNERVAASL